MTGAADDGWEHGPGGVVSGEASLHQAGAVVAHEGGSFLVVTHDGFYGRREEEDGRCELDSTNVSRKKCATLLNLN